eukprot:411031_1
MVMVKANEYIKCETVKSMVSNTHCCLEKILHYDIAPGAHITIKHIKSVIFYCDFTNYSSKFSATFRKLNSNENMESVKQRNSAFWWQSKFFRETIEIYGKTATTGHFGWRKSSQEKG